MKTSQQKQNQNRTQPNGNVQEENQKSGIVTVKTTFDQETILPAFYQ